MKWQDVVNILVGIWLIVAAFIPSLGGVGTGQGNLWNYLISGIIVAGLSLWVGYERKS